jgi:uncharacterized oxidoreductase
LRLIEWAKASPPLVAGGAVLLPGEIERATREERLAGGIPLDRETIVRIKAAGMSLAVNVDEL